MLTTLQELVETALGHGSVMGKMCKAVQSRLASLHLKKNYGYIGINDIRPGFDGKTTQANVLEKLCENLLFSQLAG